MRKFVILIVIGAAGLAGWLYWQQGRRAPFVVSGFVEADGIRVGSRVGGRVARVDVDEGATVTTGQPLYELEPFDLREKLAEAKSESAAAKAEHARTRSGYRPQEIEQARAKRDLAKATLDKLRAGPRPQEIEISREQLKEAEANLELAQADFARIDRLREDQQAAPNEYDEATRTLKAARARATAARQALALLQEGTRTEEIAEAEAQLAATEQALNLLEAGFRSEDIEQAAAMEAAAQAKVTAIEVQLSELSVTSPCDCVVEAIDLQPGDLIASNAPSVSLLDLSRMWVRTYVPEARLGEVKLGQRVPVKVDSFPEERFAARVTYIATEAEFTPRNVQTPEERSKQVFRVKVTLEEGRDRIRVGMPADVLFSEDIQP